MGRTIIICVLIAGLIFTACSRTTTEKKILDFGHFAIEVPPTWDKIKLRGIDSYVGQIAIDETDTLTFDLGWYSSSLEDGELYGLMRDTSTYETIDDRKAKIVRPKKSGEGTTGVFFDSLWVAGSGIDRFQLNGKDLKPDNERLLLEAIRTLRFKK